MRYGVTKQEVRFEEREVTEGVTLYKRDRSRLWQARIRRVSGTWISISTRTEDLEVAKAVALRRHQEMKDAQARGEIDIVRKFADVANLTMKELQSELASGVGRQSNRDYILAIRGWLIPALGRYPIAKIGHAQLVLLDQYRTDKLERKANRSTINTHNAALNRVFRTAVARGYMMPLQIPALFNNGAKTNPRPYFDDDECQLILKKLPEFIARGHKDCSRAVRELLVDYVAVLCNTGMRPGVESLNLKWNQIKRISVFRGEGDMGEAAPSTLRFAVVGKKRPRTLVCRDIDGNVSGPLKALQQRFEELKDLSEELLFKQDAYVFRTREGGVPNHQRLTKSFKIFLRWLGIEKDAHGNVRTLYSLRHTYATSGLVKDLSMETLAAQMGTSRPMIERHYSKLRPEMKVVELSGWRERAKAPAITSPDMSNLVQLLMEQNQKLMQRIEEIAREARVVQS
ncbi:MAG: site-specific integrase [Gammaproteobacteria bacterium]|nr:site-specific integrase [Gammaproteobacteria bacterium]